jgi:hypothetical protein
MGMEGRVLKGGGQVLMGYNNVKGGGYYRRLCLVVYRIKHGGFKIGFKIGVHLQIW